MNSGIGFSQIFLILVLIVICVDPKQVPGIIRKSVKIVKQVRTGIRKIFSDIYE